MSISLRKLNLGHPFDRHVQCNGCSGSKEKNYEQIQAVVEINIGGSMTRLCNDCAEELDMVIFMSGEVGSESGSSWEPIEDGDVMRARRLG